MAKHAHRLLLNQKKTWRCTLPGCSYFIHVGLAHILPGKESVCWNCGTEFTLDERALQDDQPKCIDCREENQGMISAQERSEIIEVKLVLGKMKRRISQLTPQQISTMKMVHDLTDRAIETVRRVEQEIELEEQEEQKKLSQSVSQSDEIEVDEPEE